MPSSSIPIRPRFGRLPHGARGAAPRARRAYHRRRGRGEAFMTADRVAVRVVPPRALRVAGAGDVPQRRMLAVEPRVVLGADRVPSLVTSGVPVDRRTCFGPRGA